MQDIIVTAIAFVAAGLIFRGWFKRRRTAALPKCANCVASKNIRTKTS
jgi:hypothetical protein